MPVSASWQKRFLDHFAACPSLKKSGREGSFGLARCLDKVAGAREGGLTGGRDTSIRGGATVDAGAELVISWVICCN